MAVPDRIVQDRTALLREAAPSVVGIGHPPTGFSPIGHPGVTVPAASRAPSATRTGHLFITRSGPQPVPDDG